VAKCDRAARRLATSSMTEFAASALVLAIAAMGGFINFHLIALPMSEMVGATSYVGPVRTSDIAALVIILTEIAMGLFLTESLGVTRLFPLIHALEDRLRGRMLWSSFATLLTLSGVDSSLAYMRDLLAADREALTQQLSSVAAPEVALRWIPSLGQMVMGFMLPSHLRGDPARVVHPLLAHRARQRARARAPPARGRARAVRVVRREPGAAPEPHLRPGDRDPAPHRELERAPRRRERRTRPSSCA